MENKKLGGEICGAHRWVTDIGGWSGLEHQVEWRTSSWVENIKLGGDYKSFQARWRLLMWVENFKLGEEYKFGWSTSN